MESSLGPHTLTRPEHRRLEGGMSERNIGIFQMMNNSVSSKSDDQESLDEDQNITPSKGRFQKFLLSKLK